MVIVNKIANEINAGFVCLRGIHVSLMCSRHLTVTGAAVRIGLS